MALIVQKYGGTSVANPDRIANVANRVVKGWRDGNKMVVVLSAMAGETDRLIGLAKEMAEDPDARELDVLLATGEQTTVSLFSIFLRAQGVPATSLLSHQARIYTDRAYGRARILGIDTARIKEELKKNRIVTVAGFQGVDEVGNITTLGRGGSDTTAVAMAAALKADLCEIYTDVDGVYTTDPRIYPKARKLDRISYDEMLELASMGAKVLEIRSVGFARRYDVPLVVRSSFSEDPGTLVTVEDEEMEIVPVSGVALSRNDARVTITRVPDRPGVAMSPVPAGGQRQHRGGYDHPEHQHRGPHRSHLYRAQGRPEKDPGDCQAGGRRYRGRGGLERGEHRQGLHRRCGHEE